MEVEKTVIIALVMVVAISGWLINNWIRAKYGYALEDSWGRKVEPAANEENLRLKAENRELNDKLDAMQDRMIVLEKIVTDRGYSLSAEIEALRDTPAIGKERM
jgi:hypothetical protein